MLELQGLEDVGLEPEAVADLLAYCAGLRASLNVGKRGLPEAVPVGEVGRRCDEARSFVGLGSGHDRISQLSNSYSLTGGGLTVNCGPVRQTSLNGEVGMISILTRPLPKYELVN
jgi:hypothetical protein